mgnify:CR=1 FL=1
MTYPIPTAVPRSLRAGDTATWRRSLSDYPASSGWVLSYVLVKSDTQIIITANASGADHLVSVVPATTLGWIPGIYAWQERVALAGAIHTLSTGTLEIIASFAAATTGLDARSHAQKTLSALESWIECHDLAVADYEIAGRKMQFIPIADLLQLRDAYRREVRGQGGQSGRVYMRF